MACILPEQIKALQADVKKNGGAKFLREMSSQERIDYFAKFTDYQPGNKIENRENAEMLNRQIEQKMLQPAQTAAIREWLKELPDDKRLNTFGRKKAILELMKDRKQVLSPKSDKFFMEALVKQALGFEASLEDVKKLSDLSATVEEQKKKLYKFVPDYESKSADDARNAAWGTDEGRQAWFDMGESLLKFKEQYDLMKIKSFEGTDKAGLERVKTQAKKYWEDLKAGDAKAVLKNTASAIWGVIKQVPKSARNVLASVDISGTFTQLRGLWLSNPALAAKASYAGIKAGAKELWNRNGRKFARMELMMRPNALNGNYEKFGVHIGIAEEAFPDSFLQWIADSDTASKLVIPRLFRFFSASDVAYSIGSQVGRAEVFDQMYENARDPNTKQVNLQLLQAQKIGDVANQIVGRGKITDLLAPKAEKCVNDIIFSPRLAMSRIRMITDVYYFKHYKEQTPYGYLAKASVNNYLFTAIMAALGAGIAAYARDEPVEDAMKKVFDPRSTLFGQSRFGDVRIDWSGGTAAYLRTLARMVTRQTVTAEGQLKKQEPGKSFFRFAGGKVAPGARLIGDFAQMGLHELGLLAEQPLNYNFEPITPISAIAESFIPLSIQNVIVAVKNKSWPGAGAAALDFVGISAQYWGTSEKNEGKSKELIREQERLAFKTNSSVSSLKARSNSALNTKLTGAQKERANREFETKLSNSLDRLISSSAYKKMSDAQKAKALTRERTKIQKEVKKSYGIK